jgi:hypothetical protein
MAACLMVVGFPSFALAANGNKPDPSWTKLPYTEVGLFNIHTSDNSDYYKNNQGSASYNAVAAGYFRQFGDLSNTLTYDKKEGKNRTYYWVYPNDFSKGFNYTVLAHLMDQYQQLQVGYSVTTINNPHTHSWGFLGWYSQDVTSYMDAYMYFANHNSNDWYRYITDYSGYSKSGKSNRRGNNKFKDMPDVINGNQTIWAWMSDCPDPTVIQRTIFLQFINRDYYYDGGSKTCTHGGWVEGNTVVFADKTQPVVKKVVTRRKSDGAETTNFKAGDTIQVALQFSEPVRFANDSASGMGNVYIGLKVADSTNYLYANLTSLTSNGRPWPDRVNEAVFEYVVPSNEKKLYTITNVELDKYPSNIGDAKPLWKSTADIPLRLYGRGGVLAEQKKPNSPNARDEGFNGAKSYIVDIAGNSLDPTVSASTFYIDGENPFVAKVAVSANTNNKSIKEMLGTSQLAEDDPLRNDPSDRYLGKYDTFSITLYMNEVVQAGGSISVTTNVKKSDGTYLTFNSNTSTDLSVTKYTNVGTGYGKGASKNYCSFFTTGNVRVEPGMTIEGSEGKIEITDITYNNVKDASGNSAVKKMEFLNFDKGFYLDTEAPSVEMTAAVQPGGANQRFYIPFKVTDPLPGGASSGAQGSGVQGLPAWVMIYSSGSTSQFDYAVTGKTTEPETWTTGGAFGKNIKFDQNGDQQYLHIRPVAGQEYSLFNSGVVIFDIQDYAGNSYDRRVNLSGAVLDTVAPGVYSFSSTSSYDNTAEQGTYTAVIHAYDAGGLASVEYQWTDANAALTADSSGWQAAEGTLQDGQTTADLHASVTIAKGEDFSKYLWAKVTDAGGNITVEELRQCSYSLKQIHYDLKYTTQTQFNPHMAVMDLENGGNLVFDAYYNGVHYIRTVDYDTWRSNGGANNGQIFRGGNDTKWYEATKDTSNGVVFKDLIQKNSPLEYIGGDLPITVYSGNDAAITIGTTEVAINSSAASENITLRIASSDWRHIEDAFTKTWKTCLSIDPAAFVKHPSMLWTFDDGYYLASTLEGMQLQIDIGEDKNGWDYADVDWENSYLALDGQDLDHKICGIGSGPVQTITLPASDLYTSGMHNLSLVLKRNSSALQNSSTYYFGWMEDSIYIDATEPGDLELGVMIKNSTRDAWGYGYINQNGFGEPGSYDEIPYDPDQVIYIPTEGYRVALSVEAKDVSGAAINYENSSGSGAGVYAGAMDIIAWNTADPTNKVNLRREHFTKNENGDVVLDQKWNSSSLNGKRTLLFSDTTTGGYAGYPIGTLGLTYNQDNLIAIQAVYANGKAGPVKFLTIHPVALDISGTVKTSPEIDESVYGPFSQYGTTGLLTTNAGTAKVVFTPSGVIDPGVTIYCQQGNRYSENSDYEMYEGYAKNIGEMTLQGDGTYVYMVPDANATQYENDWIAWIENNGEYPAGFLGNYAPDMDESQGFTYKKQSTRSKPMGRYIVYARDGVGNIHIIGMTQNSIIADASKPIVSGGSFEKDEADDVYTYHAKFYIKDDSILAFARANNDRSQDRLLNYAPVLNITFDDAYLAAIGAEGQNLTLDFDDFDDHGIWEAKDATRLGITKVETFYAPSQMEGFNVYGFQGSDDLTMEVDIDLYISPKITTATPVSIQLTATDAHGNSSDPVSITCDDAVGVTPASVRQEYAYDPNQARDHYSAITDVVTDYALKMDFNIPVKPDASWINPNPGGYSTTWYDGFPITSDGTWTISFTDIFGDRYSQEVILNDVFTYNSYSMGINVDFSTLDYVPAKDGVIISITPSLEPFDEQMYYVYGENPADADDYEYNAHAEDFALFAAGAEWGFRGIPDDQWVEPYLDENGTTWFRIWDTVDNKIVEGLEKISLDDLIKNYIRFPDSWTIVPYVRHTGYPVAGGKIPASASEWPTDTPTDSLTIHATENGDYAIFFWGDTEDYAYTYTGLSPDAPTSFNDSWNHQRDAHVLIIHLDNIVTGGPEEKLWIYVDDLKEQFEAGSADQFTGSTQGTVTVSYETSRKTTPNGDTSKTFVWSDGYDDSFSFEYFDEGTNLTYHINGKLSDYGITLEEPEIPYEDHEAPSIDMVHIYTAKGGMYSAVEAFSGDDTEAQIEETISSAGMAQSYDFVVNASDYSNWKVVVKSTEPSGLTYDTAESDVIDGVTVNGNNVFLTPPESGTIGDFYIAVVDSASADTASTTDNFSYVKIPGGQYRFDTTAPVITTKEVQLSLYEKIVLIKVEDLDDAGNPTANLSVMGDGVTQNTNPNYAEYQYLVRFTENDTNVVVTAFDEAKNSATVTISVTGIDVTAPTVTITWAPSFRDVNTGKFDYSNPTTGPVNTDVVAIITSDKDIMSATVGYKDDPANPNTVYTKIISPGNPIAEYRWGTVEYDVRKIKVHFNMSDDPDMPYDGITLNLSVAAPNGRTVDTPIKLSTGVIDKVAPTIVNGVFPNKRPGYSVPYEIEYYMADITEDVYCMNAGNIGEIYNYQNPLILVLKDTAPQTLRFADKAGNITTYTTTLDPGTVIDSVTPVMDVAFTDASASTNQPVVLNVTVSEDATLECDDTTNVVPGTLTQTADPEGNPIWTGTVQVKANGTFRLYAYDQAGNYTSVVFTINNIDQTLPLISFDVSTVSLRQESDPAELTALLDAGVNAWDNVAVAEGSISYDATGVNLDQPGIYAVAYTVLDTAGNEGQATRYVKVIDKHMPVITIDGALTELNGTTSIRPGTHRISVSGLRENGEPYKLQMVKGIYSAGQMKRLGRGLSVADDGSFEITSPGFYTVYVTSQSRQTFRTLLYVEK